MATKARLHWLWRGAIALVLGLSFAMLFLTRVADPLYWTARQIRRLLPAHLATDAVTEMLEVTFLLWVPILAALIAHGLLARWFGPPSADGEPHCRRCDHILRGLSEPRCPECGEAI
jgi:hypothetical protein